MPSAVTALQQDESGVTVTTASGKALRARHLIGADGANSRVARLVGLREGNWLGGAIELVGDTAGPVDPLLGEGIRHAVDSGKMAAEAVLIGDVRSYGQRVHREIGRDLLWGRLWARLLYNNAWRSFELAVRNPLFVREFLFTGEVSYRRMVARAPLNVLLGLSRRL
jgi:flavin-dependent dehydrogenase